MDVLIAYYATHNSGVSSLFYCVYLFSFLHSLERVNVPFCLVKDNHHVPLCFVSPILGKIISFTVFLFDFMFSFPFVNLLLSFFFYFYFSLWCTGRSPFKNNLVKVFWLLNFTFWKNNLKVIEVLHYNITNC